MLVVSSMMIILSLSENAAMVKTLATNEQKGKYYDISIATYTYSFCFIWISF